MSGVEQFTIQGGGHGGIELEAGESFQIVNIEGSQVVDLWAFVQPDTQEFLSTEHTRSCLQKLVPEVGDSLYSNRRRPILTIVEDTSPGIHDMLLSACDIQRYKLLGHVGYHKNCADNLTEAIKDFGHELKEIPSPFNVFERVEISQDGHLSIEPPLVEAGQYITLKATEALLVIMSACPMDIALTNGHDRRSKPVLVRKLNLSALGHQQG